MPPTPLQAAARLLASARRLAVLTGAGVSAESGVPTFRDAQSGYWSRFDPLTLATPEGFASDPGLVWRWYMSRLEMAAEAAPNPGHFALAELEKHVDSLTLLTQNVDTLHERAGSTHVVHLHGSIGAYRCVDCATGYELQPGDREADLPPSCPRCGGFIRPDVVWFGELLPQAALQAAWQAAETCDAMLVVGTSGLVYPAAQLPRIARQQGAAVIDVNPEPNEISDWADVFVQGKSGEVLPQVVEQLK